MILNLLEEVLGSVCVYTTITDILDRREEKVFRYGGKETGVNLRLIFNCFQRWFAELMAADRWRTGLLAVRLGGKN